MPELSVAAAIGLAEVEYTQWNAGNRSHNNTARMPQPHNCGTNGDFLDSAHAQSLMDTWVGRANLGGLNRSSAYSASGNDVDLLLNTGAPPALFNYHVPIRNVEKNEGNKTTEELEVHKTELDAKAQRLSRAKAQSALDACRRREGKAPFKINW